MLLFVRERGLFRSAGYWEQAVPTTSAHWYRHIVFPTAPRRPLNLGVWQPVVPANRLTAGGRTCLNDDCNDSFISWLFAEAGLRAGHYRPESLKRRMPACLRALRVETTDDARRVLRRNKWLVPTAIDALLLGVTEFFRDAAVFDELKAKLQPVAARGRCLRIWSAGCSDGPELYSAAILLAELGALETCELLGTDCRYDALRRAERGVYNASSLSGISSNRLVHHFDRAPLLEDTGAWQVRTNIRHRAVWQYADLLRRTERGPWDVIFCRNLAMYLQPHSSARLWQKIAHELRPGGVLIVGKSERVPACAGLHLLGPCMYRRAGDA
jgi:chemotaxis methyl-accepting protein methylase